jgi:hypothetical protein
VMPYAFPAEVGSRAARVMRDEPSSDLRIRGSCDAPMQVAEIGGERIRRRAKGLPMVEFVIVSESWQGS